MGWKGTMRSMAAASRAAARDAERRHKAAVKQQNLDDAYDAVQNWEDYISSLITVHVDLADAIDWEKIATSPRPAVPVMQNKNEISAQKKINSFKPNVLNKIFGTTQKKLDKLQQALSSAKDKDFKEFERNQLNHSKNLIEWENEAGLAKRLLAGDILAIKEVLKELNSLVDKDLLGDQISFQITEEFIHAIPNVHSDEIIPKVKRKLRASGTLSETKMPVGEFNDLYQDYVASVALKVAGDLFHVLPNNIVHVTCMTSMLNTKTGHMEPTPILSTQFMRRTFIDMNLEAVDPSDAMTNFVHRMNFRRTKGFSAVEPLLPLDAEFKPPL